MTVNEGVDMNEIINTGSAAVPGLQGLRPEPEVGTVLVYRVVHERDGVAYSQRTSRTYHYASIRAGDGRWYTTGRTTEQGVDWHTLATAIAESGAQVWAATGWTVFEL